MSRADSRPGGARGVARADPPAQAFVDGNNAMGSRPDGWWRDRAAAQRRLVADLGAAARGSGREWTVVFDGAPPREGALASPDGVRVEHAKRKGANAADDRIVELLEAMPEGTDAVVYTSDRGLRERAAALGARVEGAGALLRRIASARGAASSREVMQGLHGGRLSAGEGAWEIC